MPAVPSGGGAVAPDHALWVVRHAKAAAQAPDDHSRPLTARGRRQAAGLARHVRERAEQGGAVPGLVLCSSALRARQTAEPVVAALAPRVELLVERELYHADADDVVSRLRTLGDDDPPVMVVGHNPTLHDLVVLLLASEDGDRPDDTVPGFPTAALAVVGLSVGSWTGLAAGTGRLLELWRPEG